MGKLVILIFCGVGFFCSLAMVFYGYKASEALFVFGWPLMAASIVTAAFVKFFIGDREFYEPMEKGGVQCKTH